jgi:hypothetical protein
VGHDARHRERVVVECQAVDRGLDHALVEVVVQAIRRTERRRVHARQVVERVAQVRGAGRHGLRRIVRPAGIMARHAKRGGGFRGPLHPVGPVPREQFAQVFSVSCGRLRHAADRRGHQRETRQACGCVHG